MAQTTTQTLINYPQDWASGFGLVHRGGTGDSIALLAGTQCTDGVVASTTQTQAAATQLQYGLNNIATCANGNDAVALPQALPGRRVYVFNSGAQAPKYFGKKGTTDTINGTAGATGVGGQAQNKAATFICVTAGKWLMGLTA